MKRIIILAVITLVLTSCGTVAPSLIGVDTRSGIDDLTTQTQDIASQAAAIDSGVDTIAQDLADLETAAPDALKGDIRAIQAQVTTLAGLTEAHKVAAAGTAKVAEDTKGSFEEDMGEVAVLGAEKAAAEVGREKAEKSNLFLRIILFSCLLSVGVFLYLKLKP